MFEITNLSEMSNGAVNERFNYELQKVVENICDPNTDPKKKRKITLTWKLAAIRNIKKYLEEKLKEQVESGQIIIIA